MIMLIVVVVKSGILNFLSGQGTQSGCKQYEYWQENNNLAISLALKIIWSELVVCEYNIVCNNWILFQFLN